MKEEMTDEHGGELRLKSSYCSKEPGKEGTRGNFFENCHINISVNQINSDSAVLLILQVH